MAIKVRLVCATRQRADRFLEHTALGRSLGLYGLYQFLDLRLFPSNTEGLPRVYNRAIRDAADDPAVLVFVHDDVHICDFSWPVHLLEGLSVFDVVGVVGNRRRVPRQPGWAFTDERFTWDDPRNLSGVLGHGTGFPPRKLNIYGLPRQEVKLLDGVLLAARSETLLAKEVQFDERYDFHFYDMDFCRRAEQQSLRMGTCSVSMIHESDGNYGGPAWRAAYQRYLEKWSD
jgi:hypothetical protein